jgi:hypothetical protein
MRMVGAKVVGVVLAAVAAGTAYAAMWDWTMEVQSRHWRTASLNWARNIHPAHPSTSWIQSNYIPPAHEIWCHNAPSPTAADCDEFSMRLEEWLQDFLDVSDVPESAFNTFPKECASVCTP